MNTIDHIRTRLASLELRKLANGYVREAAVLIPVFEADGGYRLLLTRRTEGVQTHKGQISFPGGMREGGEPLLETAFRETFEEVGIARDRIELLGRFHDYRSVTEFRVAPFVALLRTPFETRRQVQEVAEILCVPFGAFLDPKSLHTEKRSYPGGEMDVVVYSHGANQIWGLTARIIKDLFDTLDLER